MKDEIKSLENIDLSRASEWFLCDDEADSENTLDTTDEDKADNTERNSLAIKKLKDYLTFLISSPVAVLIAIVKFIINETYSYAYEIKLINERKNTLILHSEIYNKELISNISKSVYFNAARDLNKKLFKLPPGYFEEAKGMFKAGDLVVDNSYMSVEDRIELELSYYDSFKIVLPLNIVNAKSGEFYSAYKHINMDKLMSVILFDVAKKKGYSEIEHIGSFDNEDETLKIQNFEIKDKHGFSSIIEINHSFRIKGSKRVYSESSFEFTTDGRCIYNAVGRKLRCLERKSLQKQVVANIKGSKLTKRM